MSATAESALGSGRICSQAPNPGFPCSNSGNDQRHRFSNAFVPEVPVGKGLRLLTGAHGLVQQALGGWSLSGITNIATENSFTVYANPVIDFSGFNSFGDRSDIVAQDRLPSIAETRTCSDQSPLDRSSDAPGPWFQEPSTICIQ
jgi:hypothetical protein